MRKMIWILSVGTVGLLIGAAGCGFDCEAKCKDEIHRIYEPGRQVVPSVTLCTSDAVKEADSCEKCDAALAEETGHPVDLSTCD